MYLFQYNLLKSRFGSNIMFLHIWTVILMYYVYGNKIIFIVIIIIIVIVICKSICAYVNNLSEIRAR